MHRLRTFILITGAPLSSLIAVAFIVSGWWSLWVALPGGGSVAIHAGARQVWETFPTEGAGYEMDLNGMLHPGGVSPGLYSYIVPLTLPFVAVAIPTLLVWRFWPQPIKPGHCRCGYDLIAPG